MIELLLDSRSKNPRRPRPRLWAASERQSRSALGDRTRRADKGMPIRLAKRRDYARRSSGRSRYGALSLRPRWWLRCPGIPASKSWGQYIWRSPPRHNRGENGHDLPERDTERITRLNPDRQRQATVFLIRWFNGCHRIDPVQLLPIPQAIRATVL